MSGVALMFWVHCWGSHPQSDNDDCWTGVDFASEAEARAFFLTAETRLPIEYPKIAECAGPETEYFTLEGPGVLEIRPNPRFQPEKAWYTERDQARIERAIREREEYARAERIAQCYWAPK